MRNQDRTAILQAAARTLVWRLFGAANYCRRPHRIDLDEFDRMLRSAVRQWNAANRNLNHRKEPKP
jgi:hypothetical protein